MCPRCPIVKEGWHRLADNTASVSFGTVQSQNSCCHRPLLSLDIESSRGPESGGRDLLTGSAVYHIGIKIPGRQDSSLLQAPGTCLPRASTGTIPPAVDTTVALRFQTLPLDFTIRGECAMVGPGSPRLKPLSCPEVVVISWCQIVQNNL